MKSKANKPRPDHPWRKDVRKMTPREPLQYPGSTTPDFTGRPTISRDKRRWEDPR